MQHMLTVTMHLFPTALPFDGIVPIADEDAMPCAAVCKSASARESSSGRFRPASKTLRSRNLRRKRPQGSRARCCHADCLHILNTAISKLHVAADRSFYEITNTFTQQST